MKTKRYPTIRLASFLIAVFVTSLLIVACTSNASPVAFEGQQGSQQGQGGQSGGQQGDQQAQGGASAQATARPLAQQPQDRMIIKNAELQLVVEKPQATLTNITNWVEANGGWIVSSNVMGSSEATQATMAMRVPAEHFSAAIEYVKSEAQEVAFEKTTGDDVTDAYTDISSQVRNLEAAEAQLQQIMDAASSTDDVLKVYDQLVNVRGQIETLKGRMQFYSQSAAYSSINLTLRAPTTAQPINVSGWSIEGVVREAFGVLIGLGQLLASLVVWLVIVGIPVLLVIGLPSLVWYRVSKRRRPTPKAQEQQS